MQCPKTHWWNTRGQIKQVRFNEAGTIVSYDVMLENRHLTSRHRRYLTRDIPGNVVDEAESPIPDDIVDIPIHDGAEVSTESGVQTKLGVVTRGMKELIQHWENSTQRAYQSLRDIFTFVTVETQSWVVSAAVDFL